MSRNPKAPLSIEAQAVISAGMSRRLLMRGVLASGALVAVGSLAGCGTEGTQKDKAACVSTDLSGSEKKLAISNWPLYIDTDEKDEKKRPSLDAFIASTGIQVAYTEDVNDNSEFFGKIRNQLAGCQSTDRDIVVLTDWMAARLVRNNWVQPLNKGNLPNVSKNLLTKLHARPWDPEDKFSVPWQSGLAGIAFNGGATKEVRTIDELLTRSDLKGKVTALKEMRDTMGLLLQAAGYDPSNFTESQFDTALEKLRGAVKSGQIRRFTGNDYAQDLAKGDVAACIGWSGDVIQLNFEDEKVKFVAPDSGVMLFSDNMLVPNKATHKTHAEAFMNYYYDPKVAAQVAASVNYICPVQGAQAEMEKIDKDLASNPLIFPDAAMLGKTKVFMALTEAQERTYEEKFKQVTGT